MKTVLMHRLWTWRWFVAGLLLVALTTLPVGCSDDSSDSGSSSEVFNSGTSGSQDATSGTSGTSGNTWNGGTSGTSSSNDTGSWSSSGGSDTSGSTSGSDASSGFDSTSGGNTNISFGGSQDFGYFRSLVAAGQVPQLEDFDPEGFFAEHHTPLPDPVCGQRVCLQAMLGAMGSLLDTRNPCTMLQLGLNSPIVIDPTQRPPLTLSVVIDVSGSMSGDKITFVRQGLGQLIDGLRDEDQISIITYSDNATVAFEMDAVVNNRVELRNIAASLTANGSTNIYDGLAAGFQQAFSHYDSGRQHRVILLSDGQATAGNTSTPDIISMSRAFNSDGIGLTTIGLGTDFNFQLMRDLALQGDGNFYFLENSAAVSEVFTEELSYFTLPVAFDIKITLREGSYFSFMRATGSPFWEDAEDGGSLEIPSVFLAHRIAHDDVTPDGGRRGGGSALLIELMPKPDDSSGITEADVATIDISFREPGTNAIINDSITVNYPHAPWNMLSTGFFENSIVTKSFVMLNIFVGLEAACRLFHANNPGEAVAVLDRLIAATEDYNEELNDGSGDTDMDYNLILMRDLRNLIQRLSAPPPPPPDNIPDDPWPAD